MHSTTALVVLALATATAAQQPAPQADPVRFTDAILPGQYHIRRGDEFWLCHRIVDDLTGAPIAGAELFLVQESATPVGGRFWSTRSAKSDQDGIVRVRTDDIDGKWHLQVVKAAGHATVAQPGPGEPVWRLPAALDVPVLVCDWRGLPAPNALVGFCGSCGHGPDVAFATSQANGVATLRGIDPHQGIRDLYVQGDGLGLGYVPLGWSPGCPPFRLACERAPALVGRLLDHRGQPVAGAFVGTQSVHRGPWTETDRDGRFRLLGAPEGTAPIAWVRGLAGQVRDDVYFKAPRAWPATLHLPDPQSEPNHEGTVEDVPGPAAVATTTVTVQVEGTPAPSVRVDWPGRNSAQEDEPGRLTVPTTGPFAIHVGDRTLPFADLAALPPQPIPLRDFPPTQVLGKVVDADGKPAAARLRFLGDENAPEIAVAADGTLRGTTTRVGMAIAELQPERAGLLRRRLFVPLPDRGDDARVDLGALVLRAEAQLRVLGPDGRPDGRLRAGLVRTGFQAAGEPRWCDLDAEGRWLGYDLRDGDAVVVVRQSDGDGKDAAVATEAVPFRTVLHGTGPYAITAPGGSLLLTVTGSADEEGRAYVQFGDFACDLSGSVRLVGLPAGPLQVLVTAFGCQSAIADVVIPATGEKELKIALPRR